MATFAYQAVDASGVRKQGRLDAASQEAARRALRERGLSLVSMRSVEPTSGGAASDASGARQGPPRMRPAGALPMRGLSIAVRQLATLAGNGVQLEEALRIAARQASAPVIARALDRVRTNVTEGRSLSEAMTGEGDAFPRYVRASIAAGERSGRLPDVLAHLALHLEARSATQNKLGLALLYPILLATISIGIVTLLMVYVVPDIVRIFVDRGVELPLSTRILIGLSSFLSEFGLALAAAMGALALLAFRMLRQPSARLIVDRFANTAPGVRVLSRQINSARFSGSLATLILSGVPVLEAVRASAASVSNAHVRARIETAARYVNDGGSLSAALEQAKCFPPVLIAMVASGESSGRLGIALERASNDQQRELDQTIAATVALVEPGVLLVMGGIVLFLVLSILTPIVNLNTLAG